MSAEIKSNHRSSKYNPYGKIVLDCTLMSVYLGDSQPPSPKILFGIETFELQALDNCKASVACEEAVFHMVKIVGETPV